MSRSMYSNAVVAISAVVCGMAAVLAVVDVATVALVVCADGLRTGVVASGRRRKRRRRREERPARPEDRLCAGMEAGRRRCVTPKRRVEEKGREAGDIGRRGKAWFGEWGKEREGEGGSGTWTLRDAEKRYPNQGEKIEKGLLRKLATARGWPGCLRSVARR